MVEKTVPQTQNPEQAVRESSREPTRYVTPPVDIYEQDDKLVVLADLPGVEKDNLRVNVEDDVLTIEGTPTHAPSATPLWREYEMVSFYRQFYISERIDIEKISAALKSGVLHLELPKAEKAKPRQIEIKHAS